MVADRPFLVRTRTVTSCSDPATERMAVDSETSDVSSGSHRVNGLHILSSRLITISPAILMNDGGMEQYEESEVAPLNQIYRGHGRLGQFPSHLINSSDSSSTERRERQRRTPANRHEEPAWRV